MTDLEAASAFRDTMAGRHDGRIGGSAVWHGWAITEAFIAGVEYAKAEAKADWLSCSIALIAKAAEDRPSVGRVGDV